MKWEAKGGQLRADLGHGAGLRVYWSLHVCTKVLLAQKGHTPLSLPSASANKAHGLPAYFANKVLLQHYLHPFIYILSVAVFTLQQQCQVFATDTGWLT